MPGPGPSVREEEAARPAPHTTPPNTDVTLTIQAPAPGPRYDYQPDPRTSAPPVWAQKHGPDLSPNIMSPTSYARLAMPERLDNESSPAMTPPPPPPDPIPPGPQTRPYRPVPVSPQSPKSDRQIVDERAADTAAMATAARAMPGRGEEGFADQQRRTNEKRQSLGPPLTSAQGRAIAQPGSSQSQLMQYRERLARDIARDLERREALANGLVLAPVGESPVAVYPNGEDVFASPLQTASTATSVSTESGHTIRGGVTPGLIAATPSYPFPRMAAANMLPSRFYGPFAVMSPGITSPGASPYPGGRSLPPGAFAMHESVTSTSSTPGSAMTFNPTGVPPPQQDNLDYPTPNLYDLSLMLNSEPGLDSWWNTVVQIMTEVYLAERVTLAVPADATDPHNVPWGQKATYNGRLEDDFSMGYLARGGSLAMGSLDMTPEPSASLEEPLRLGLPKRPHLSNRHSFTAFEENRVCPNMHTPPVGFKRPAVLPRSKSYFPTKVPDAVDVDISAPQPKLNELALEEHNAAEDEQFEIEQRQENIPSWEAPLKNRREGQGRVLPVLQALDYEADPLIDHGGVMRILERGKVIALTRTYPYLQDPSSCDPPNRPKPTSKDTAAESARKKQTTASAKLSSILSTPAGTRGAAGRGTKGPHDKGKNPGSMSRFDDDTSRPLTPKYEEYEQAPPSPWSQSPAPSPAVRSDSKENPFFTDATVDEDTFNPTAIFPDYSSMRPPEAIGVDNSYTVLHVPLTYTLPGRATQPFRLDANAVKDRPSQRGGSEQPTTCQTPDDLRKPKPVPIAILSILSPTIPYPSHLRHSLDHLSPHLATSFSLCRQYTSLETQLAGLQRRRPQTAGFGAVTAEGRVLEPSMNMSFLDHDDMIAQQSLAGSITSPSDYSTISKSATGTPSGTPGWDQGLANSLLGRRPRTSSPSGVSGDGYFSSKQKPTLVRSDTSASLAQRALKSSGSKESSSSSGGDKRQRLSDTCSAEKAARNLDDLAYKQDDGAGLSGLSGLSSSAPTQQPGTETSLRDELLDQATPMHRHAHTMLHSYGADFASTFQSLPPSSTIVPRGLGTSTVPSRSGTLTNAGPSEMPPPSDRLKGLMLDTLPAHVFVALPQSGEIVWVNSRYLSYRGQTTSDLVADPWGSIHPDDREDYLKAWSHSLRTGEQFSRTVRIRRFDGAYRWFYARAVASRDKRGIIMQFIGSYMDIHDQHIAELKAARQEEIEASEAKHRLLANLIPQIIFTATEDEGITFANEQWLSYTGQAFEDSLGLGFMDHVHPDDLAKCRIPADKTPPRRGPAMTGSSESVFSAATIIPPSLTSLTAESSIRGVHQSLSRHNSSSSSSVYEMPTADLAELARKGIIKVATDSNGRLSYTTEVRLRSKNGGYRWHLIRCVEIDNIDFGSGASSYFGSATDINDHKLLEAKLKEAMESKGRFLSNMSHEIRTPLIGISGMVSFLQDTTLNEEQRDYTNTIQTSANSLLLVINDILDLSKVDAGMMKLKFEWFHTRSLIEDVNELVSSLAIQKHLELNYVVEEDVPAWVKGDKIRIRQVLLNVIGNAIKFTTKGEVFSRCRVHSPPVTRPMSPRSPERREIILEFAIMDTGRGFTEEEAELIFKPFSQIDGSSTRQHGGSGLGLVISRQLTELHGGKMEGTAIPGKGSTFTFTAKFGLPTATDYPDPKSPTTRDAYVGPIPAGFRPYPPRKSTRPTPAVSPARATTATTDMESPVLASSGSSDPSVYSSPRSVFTDRTSITSVNAGLARFSEAAKASGQDLSQMKLEMPPSTRSSPGATPRPDEHKMSILGAEARPPMYSILIVCPQTHSREATAQHIEMTLPKDVPHQVTALASVEEAQLVIGGDDPVIFTHLVLNLPSAEAIIRVLDQVTRHDRGKTTMLILSDSVQRQTVLKLAAGTKHEKLLSDNRVMFIYKPVKPSRFAVIFDPHKMHDASIDRNRSTAQRMVESQKASYIEIEKCLGGKGYKVLLVEDNQVNQKVMTKYLVKVGVVVELARDGEECIEMVTLKPHEYYCLILCDLHMPRKDGYQACREIRQWEEDNGHPKLPMIALSANVMSDVQDKCIEAGFDNYVTKPVDFIQLSTSMAKFFEDMAEHNRFSPTDEKAEG